MVSAILLLAEGAEEMEAVITADILRRGGLQVTIAGVDGDSPMLCSRNVRIVPDTTLQTALVSGPYDVVVLPGGLKGSENLAASTSVGKLLKEQENNNAFIAAVCAAPTALLAHNIGKGKRATSHPSMKDKLSSYFDYSEDRVVVDGKLITSRGPGTCFEFGLAIVEQIQGKEKADSLVAPMLVKL